ncbi:MAG: hypothetical protein ACI96M_000409 [Candidatus Azotimanducaceae bacterium]|jgi:hypothetical protein
MRLVELIDGLNWIMAVHRKYLRKWGPELDEDRLFLLMERQVGIVAARRRRLDRDAERELGRAVAQTSAQTGEPQWVVRQRFEEAPWLIP